MTKNQTRLEFAAFFFLAGVIYILLPHLRLPGYVVSVLRWVFAWTAVGYLLFGFLTNREGGVFLACRSFVAATGVFFLTCRKGKKHRLPQ